MADDKLYWLYKNDEAVRFSTSKTELRAEINSSNTPEEFSIRSQKLGPMEVETTLPDQPGSLVRGSYSGSEIIAVLVEDIIDEDYWMVVTGKETGSTVLGYEIDSPVCLYEVSSLSSLHFPRVITTDDELKNYQWPLGTVLNDRDRDRIELRKKGWTRTSRVGQDSDDCGDWIVTRYLPADVINIGTGVELTP